MTLTADLLGMAGYFLVLSQLVVGEENQRLARPIIVLSFSPDLGGIANPLLRSGL